MKLTPWFDEHKNPVRAGWYETTTPMIADTMMRWWDGKCWRLGDNKDSFKVLYQLRKWRGLRK